MTIDAKVMEKAIAEARECVRNGWYVPLHAGKALLASRDALEAKVKELEGWQSEHTQMALMLKQDREVKDTRLALLERVREAAERKRKADTEYAKHWDDEGEIYMACFNEKSKADRLFDTALDALGKVE